MADTSSLTEAACIPCRGGVPTLTAEGIASLVPQVPAWQVIDKDGVLRLSREFTFADFKKALDFAVQVGELAEREKHHPDLHVSWGKLVVETWTHKIQGLHRNDFVLAAKIDLLFGKVRPG